MTNAQRRITNGDHPAICSESADVLQAEASH